jgi:hypothetical protein
MTTSGKAQITITPTAGQSKRYGESNQAITYSITSGALVGSDTLSGSLTYTGTNVGSYTITRGTLTHTKYDITLAPEVFEITAATQSAVSLLSVSSTFNPANKTVLLSGAGGSSSGTYSFALDPSNATDGTDGCSVTGSTLTYTSVGICLVTVTRSSDSNFLTRSDVHLDHSLQRNTRVTPSRSVQLLLHHCPLYLLPFRSQSAQHRVATEAQLNFWELAPVLSTPIKSEMETSQLQVRFHRTSMLTLALLRSRQMLNQRTMEQTIQL